MARKLVTSILSAIGFVLPIFLLSLSCILAIVFLSAGTTPGLVGNLFFFKVRPASRGPLPDCKGNAD